MASDGFFFFFFFFFFDIQSFTHLFPLFFSFVLDMLDSTRCDNVCNSHSIVHNYRS